MPAKEAVTRRELLAGGAQLMAAAALSSRAGAANPSEAPLLRKIPASGEELPLIGLGTSRTFEVGESSAERAPLKEVLEGFFAAGARQAGLRAIQLLARYPRRGEGIAAAGRGARRRGAGQSPLRGWRVVQGGARQAPARVGGGTGRRELGAAGTEVHRRASRGHLHHSRHRQARAPAGQPRRRPRAAAGRAPA